MVTSVITGSQSYSDRWRFRW